MLRLALMSGIATGAVVLARNKSAVVGLAPKPLKDAVKSSALYRADRAAPNRRRIAQMAADGELFCQPPTPDEAAQIIRE